MATGKVRFFNAAKGFGLITPDSGGADLFVNSADIISSSKSLKVSQIVQFDVMEGPKGICAVKLRLA